MPTIFAALFFIGLFAVATRGAGRTRAPRVFTLQAGKRYRVAVKVTPPLDDIAREPFRATLTQLGFSSVNIGSDGQNTQCHLQTPPQPVTLTFTEGQNIQLVGRHVLTLENVGEL